MKEQLQIPLLQWVDLLTFPVFYSGILYTLQSVLLKPVCIDSTVKPV